MAYETGRRKIHQLADRLRFQANIWNGNEQEFTDLLPQQLFYGRQVVKDVSYLNPEHAGGK